MKWMETAIAEIMFCASGMRSMGDTMKICGFVLNGSVKSLVVCCVAFLGNQLVQAGRMLKRARIAALPLLALSSVLGLVGTSQAATGYSGGIPWQTGDIVVCFGTSGGFGGACNVLRIVNGTAILLDEFTDNLGGDTFGVAISNSLHVVATDDAGGSKVVVYSVPSLNVNVSPATPLAHTPVRYLPDPEPYYDTSANGGAMVKAVAINNAGNIFVLNSTSNTGNPNIVEIGPGPSQTAVATVSLSSCHRRSHPSHKHGLERGGSSAYVTSGGNNPASYACDWRLHHFCELRSQRHTIRHQGHPSGGTGECVPIARALPPAQPTRQSLSWPKVLLILPASTSTFALTWQ